MKACLVITSYSIHYTKLYDLIALGYAAWEAGQLERELKDNSWLVTDANPEIIFNTNDSDKWDASIKNMGIDLSKLSMLSGRA